VESAPAQELNQILLFVCGGLDGPRLGAHVFFSEKKRGLDRQCELNWEVIIFVSTTFRNNNINFYKTIYVKWNETSGVLADERYLGTFFKLHQGKYSPQCTLVDRSGRSRLAQNKLWTRDLRGVVWNVEISRLINLENVSTRRPLRFNFFLLEVERSIATYLYFYLAQCRHNSGISERPHIIQRYTSGVCTIIILLSHYATVMRNTRIRFKLLLTKLIC
jgi:hypothetical protein